MQAQQKVFADWSICNQPIAEPVFRDDSDTQFADAGCRPVGYIFTQALDATFGPVGAFSGVQYGTQQLALTIALDAGNTNDLASLHNQAHIGQAWPGSSLSEKT